MKQKLQKEITRIDITSILDKNDQDMKYDLLEYRNSFKIVGTISPRVLDMFVRLLYKPMLVNGMLVIFK